MGQMTEVTHQDFVFQRGNHQGNEGLALPDRQHVLSIDALPVLESRLVGRVEVS